MTDIHCSRCSAPLTAGARFCSTCGHDVSGQQAAIATAGMPAVPPPPAEPQADLLRQLRQATLGDYDIVGELGRGGMATVFLGHDIALDRKVAIKVMFPSLVTGPGMVERFKREARTAASLSHPNIIPIYAVRETNQLLFFVMKFVDGRGLDTVVREHGQLPIPMVQAILSQVGGALGYAHRRGIVHRDIKPANIMLDDEGWAVVTDFGIAKVSDARGLTMTGVAIGTPSYMSPEQCGAKEITGASDQYSLGVVAYEMLTGLTPFRADSLMAIMWQHFNEPPPPILERRPDCPPALAAAVMRMLAKGPAERWPSMEDAVAGAPVLSHDDPVRLQMRNLARAGHAAQMLSQVHTPESPIPATRPEAPAPPLVSPDAPTMPSGASAAPPAPTAAPPVGDVPTVPSSPVPADRPYDMTLPPVAPTRPPAAPTAPPATAPPQPVWTVAAAPAAPAPAPPPTPKTQRAPARTSLLRVAGIVAVLGAGGAAAWLAFGPGRAGQPTGLAAGGEPLSAPVSTILVGPSPTSIAVGGSMRLTAIAADSLGNPLTGRAIAWRSSDSAVARVSSAGVVEGLTPGTATIAAASEGREGAAFLTVTETRARVAALEITPGTVNLAPGDTATLRALPKDQGGTILGDREVAWTSSDRAVLDISRTGGLLARGEGAATITAVVEGVRTTLRVAVTQPPVASIAVSQPPGEFRAGQTATLTATVRDARGRIVTDRPVTWASSDERTVSVTAAGLITARREGTARITATAQGRTGEIRVTVAPPPPAPVAAVAVAPRTAEVEVGQTVTIAATLRDARNQAVTDRLVAWRSSDEQIATVTAGIVTGRRAGRVTITATSESQSASATVTVTAPPAPVTPPVAQPEPVTPGPTAGAGILAMRSGAIAAGTAHTCGVLQDGATACWGTDAAGQVGLASGQRGLVTLAAGDEHTCGLSADGAARCWGTNKKGQLGGGRTSNRAVTEPVTVAGARRYTALTAGAQHTCGIADDGGGWCWGANGSGQLGNGSTRDSPTPVAIAGGHKFKALAGGEEHTCGLTTAGKVYCWGDGFSGQIGRGILESSRDPYPVDLPAAASGIAAGRRHSCAVLGTGVAYCWGDNQSGEVGDGSSSQRMSPSQVAGTTRFASLAAGREFTCGLTGRGEAYCWGRNREGQLGDSTRANKSRPVRVRSLVAIETLAAGERHVCALTEGRLPVCWGTNASGQLGTNGKDGSPVPVPVSADIVRR